MSIGIEAHAAGATFTPRGMPWHQSPLREGQKCFLYVRMYVCMYVMRKLEAGVTEEIRTKSKGALRVLFFARQ